MMLPVISKSLHNLKIEGKLRSVANPKSEHRYEIIRNLNKQEDPVEQVLDLLENMTVQTLVPEKDVANTVSSVPEIEVPENQLMCEFPCKLCKATYRRMENLKLHMTNKQPGVDVNHCKVWGSIFTNETELKKRMLDHSRCNFCDVQFEDIEYLTRSFVFENSITI